MNEFLLVDGTRPVERMCYTWNIAPTYLEELQLNMTMFRNTEVILFDINYRFTCYDNNHASNEV